MKFTYIIFILVFLITLTSCNNRINKTKEVIPIVDTVDTINKISDTLTTEKDTNKTVGKYTKLVEYVVDDIVIERTIRLTKNKEYLISSNSNDIFIYLYKKVNINPNKNTKLTFIENGKDISYKCNENGEYYLKIMKVSSMDSKSLYLVNIQYFNH